ncbi:phosphatidate cytidylyltransferase [Roseomonas frigidaquae]|uniref:Phosphatidate cytidylyltransferase n=1 Tax=Falsiroseomonas frigidaquae TaxID=487318 RepID=A0ABX1F3W0_9PROT|nr:phosphatidate cytidylyltransferase [Falsiroseomonas frigidaquae]NKE46987.1 phosphatidate cytidylyltransferase [Falsiroseomonas frigidaquae]
MSTAFAHPVTVWIVSATVAVVAAAALAIGLLSVSGRVQPALRKELWLRLGSWCVLLPLMIGPVLAGREWTIGAVTLLGLLCYREYARATGLFRERLLSAVVVLGILAVNFAALDHWYGFFVALWPLTTCVLAVASIPLDRPAGYVQRVGLAVLGYMLFGAGLAHLGYMANDANYRPLVLLLLTAVALNDVAAFTCGKLIGGPKLLPATSPNKTISGALGAVVVTASVVALIGSALFGGTGMQAWHWLALFGVLVSVAGQSGDLMLSSIKRDIGIKDMGVVLPGHGGILDRFNSLLLVAPAVFHLIQYFIGFGLDQPVRLFTGGG